MAGLARREIRRKARPGCLSVRTLGRAAVRGFKPFAGPSLGRGRAKFSKTGSEPHSNGCLKWIGGWRRFILTLASGRTPLARARDWRI